MTDLMARIKPSGQEPAEAPTRRGSGRWDIQGLRAVAVLVVVLDHLTGWPGGGFVGVDVFFVISGFIITSTLIREHAKSGTISAGNFYRRRIRRIIPAATLVLVATVVASRIIQLASRAESVTGDAVAAFFFSANWRFGLTEVNYFNQDLAPSPLQHYWSLSVEEQFYFVWPWLMLLILVLVTRRGHAKRTALIVAGLAIVVISLASVAYAMWETGAEPNRAYFSTVSRAWELGIGAALAVASPLLYRIPNVVRPALSWAGLLLIVASLWLIDANDPFPAPWAALPVLASAAVLAAGTYEDHRKQLPFAPLLTNRLSHYIGDRSYALYLWHFPIIILGFQSLGNEDTTTKLILAAAMAVVTIYSYRLWEDPIRHSGWLEPGNRRPSRDQRESLWTDSDKNVALSAAVLVLVFLAVGSYRHVNQESTAVDLGVDAATIEDQADDLPPKLADLQGELISALEARSWPTAVEESIDATVTGSETDADLYPCGNAEVTDPTKCTWGDPNAVHTAVTIGDSESMSYVAALRAAFIPGSAWEVTSLGGFGCAYTSIDTTHEEQDLATRCPEVRDRATAAINSLKPDVVFLTQFNRADLAPGGPMSTEEWQASIAAELAKIKVPTRIVFLERPPSEKDLNTCYTRGSAPADCVTSVTDDWVSQFTADVDLAATLDDGMVIDSRPWFCTFDKCPPFAGSVLTKMDANHMSPAYAKRLGPVILESLTKGGALARR